MTKVKNKILLALLCAFLIVPCMLLFTACGEEHKAQEKWTNDATNHWHACTVEGCEDKTHVLDKAEHDFMWVVTKEATCTALGSKYQECKVCGYKTDAEVIAIKDHVYSKYELNDTQHWQVCDVCHNETPKLDHTYDENKNGGKVCTACGYINGVAVVGTGDTMVVYDTLPNAITGASENDKIVLIKDINLGSKNVTISKKITLDLNDKTLTGNGANGLLYVVDGGDLTITGNGNVIAIAGTDEKIGATTGTIWAMAVWAKGGKVTIEGGNFSNATCEGQNIGNGNSESTTQTPDNLDLIYASDDTTDKENPKTASIVIKGGVFQCVQTMWTLNIKNDSDSTIKVQGGTFISYDPSVGDNGMSTEKTNHVLLDEGYISQQIGDTGNYIVVKATTLPTE